MFAKPGIHSKFVANPISITPIIEPRRDENLYEDEEQLAAEFAALLPDGLVPPPLIEVNPDEFEKLYIWFLS